MADSTAEPAVLVPPSCHDRAAVRKPLQPMKLSSKAWTVVVRSDAVVVAAGELVDDETGLDRWVVA